MKIVQPSKELLLQFKKELWKDQRKLETIKINGESCLIKEFENEYQARVDADVLRFLISNLGIGKVPPVVAEFGNQIIFPYVRGIRIFNLFVELDNLPADLRVMGFYIKKNLLTRCAETQKEIQLKLWAYSKNHSAHNNIYPIGEKLLGVVDLLSAALMIEVDRKKMLHEIEYINLLWGEMAYIPFRDATTKNMVLASQDLWLGNFDGEEDRKRYLISSLRDGSYETWMNMPIYDFDFSSSSELSSPEDDVVSLFFHERTWNGLWTTVDKYSWLDSGNNIRLALTFLIRYYRFGGRKAAYRLLHPSGHRIRFRYDTDIFYFKKLLHIIPYFWIESIIKIPEILRFTENLARNLSYYRSSIDFILAENLGEKRNYYVDMYPQ